MIDTVLLVGVTAVVVPQALIEPRYFVVPAFFVVMRTSSRVNVNLSGVDVAVQVFVNIATLFVFLNRPFTAPDGSVGRYMW